MRTAYWFERVSDSTWVRHKIATGDVFDTQLGAVAVDCDLDGLVDVAYSLVWLRNPGGLSDQPDTPWQAHEYGGKGHDILSGDVNDDGFDVSKSLFWSSRQDSG